MKVFSSWNCGKESCLACHKVLSEGFDVSYLLDIQRGGISPGTASYYFLSLVLVLSA